MISPMNLQEKLAELEKKYNQVASTNEELSTRLSELFILYNLTRILSTTFDLNKVFQNIFQLFDQSLPVSYSLIMFEPDFAEKLHLDRCYGIGKKKKKEFPIPSTAVYQTVRNSDSAIHQLIDHTELAEEPQNKLFSEPMAFIGMPLTISNGQKPGALFFFREQENPFSESEMSFLVQIANEVSNILDKIFLFYRTKEDTYRDHLTGAYNRRYFNQRLEIEIKRAERYRRNLSILMIDIDNFKQINDQYGHIVGDDILKNLTQILESNLRTSDVLVRYGGEEFVAILPETSAQNAFLAGEKLRAAVEQTLKLPGQGNGPQSVTISIGVANFPVDAHSSEKLVQIADERLYLAKSRGKNCTVHADLKS